MKVKELTDEELNAVTGSGGWWNGLLNGIGKVLLFPLTHPVFC
ncbi:bacteriocin-type signal sequence-containing protein [Bifidobacterium bohemicum]|uniref:Bacteriocin-type signal sequence n=1 Tax=Bifidobacterium bohemicum DSM 22767 TaxID=1437606 RepID=A0A086ZK87_9BIFI|nr:bacteriocin [Bifidobacterium bohemicum]KFI46937.1 hypothetical protein BBOH_0411 [Bifidobacterium bohemicum DSM 22767]SCB85608.1 bacteriocin-type signal sequence-containing protein [Bifidobacterium bohemicum]